VNYAELKMFSFRIICFLSYNTYPFEEKIDIENMAPISNRGVVVNVKMI